MHSAKAFFLVNSKPKVNLLDKSIILLFGTVEYFKKSIIAFFPNVVRDQNDILTLKSGDVILECYYGNEEVIEKFVLVDVRFSDSPEKELIGLCQKYNWHLYDLETEKYLL